jgi:uncharacterized membrane protein
VSEIGDNGIGGEMIMSFGLFCTIIILAIFALAAFSGWINNN